MAKFRHLNIPGPERPDMYTYPQKVRGGEFPRPARDRVSHANLLRQQLAQAEALAASQIMALGGGVELTGISLEFRSDPGFELWLKSLESYAQGIELANVRRADGITLATVFVPSGKLEFFFKRLDEFATEDAKSGNPKHDRLVSSIAEIRLAVVRSFWTDAPDLFPQETGQSIWWEVWLRAVTPVEQDDVFARFVTECEKYDIRLNAQVSRFPERLVLLAFASARQWGRSPELLNLLAELRKAKEVPTEYLNLRPSEQAEFIHDAVRRVIAPGERAPAVCLLDTGIHWRHPLLKVAISESDVLAAKAGWSGEDHNGHGTGMAGIALYGNNLAELVSGAGEAALLHRLESVKLLPASRSNDPENYGSLTQQAVARAEAQNHERSRTICLAITASDDRDHGYPSAWSAAIDQHSSGALDGFRRLYVISAGNIYDLTSNPDYRYPDTNRNDAGIRDPGQSFNALTVGAYTNLVQLRSEEFRNWRPLAPLGSLCPSSCTSMMWEEAAWPLKPDIVMEGGNYGIADGHPDACSDLSMLTTTLGPDGRLFDTMCDTSGAAAQAARFAAIIQSQYPGYWPETIRGLLVHSAAWTESMRQEFPSSSKTSIHRRLRCYGYGVPDLDRAIWTANNRVSLIYQGELQPYRREGSQVKTKDYHLHNLPWPVQALRALPPAVQVRVRITLSYFIEPSPGRVRWRTAHRYQSHGLRFKVKGPTESLDEFKQRISKAAQAEEELPESFGEPQDWLIGSRVRARGSIHSDWWQDTGASIADCGYVAVFPVMGWWRERKHLGRYDSMARYSLLVTIMTRESEIDLYTPIATQLAIVNVV